MYKVSGELSNGILYSNNTIMQGGLQYCLQDIYEEMKRGNFLFQKANAEFSRMAPDQVHNQNNKVIKGSGGATNLLNKQDESALIRCKRYYYE